MARDEAELGGPQSSRGIHTCLGRMDGKLRGDQEEKDSGMAPDLLSSLPPFT